MKTNQCVLTLIAVFLTMAVWYYASISVLKAITLFLGLEGTVFLASALSPPHGEMEEMPKGFLKMLLWSFTDGRDLAYPTRYNPVFFYGGLVFLAVSFVLSAI
ncbi:MAG: hypothetical protein HYS65_14420 [Betaproteobacteria bacterium]|nr:hypothetical protein [Betaproteobacteria bacterium]MBI2224985.1 hypothetical protein [Betaproteobacteria bacterium]